MSDTKKKSNQRTKQNVLETLKDLGSDSVSQTKDLLKDTSEDFFRELMGMPGRAPKRSGELSAGDSMSMEDVINGKEEENKKLRGQIRLERNLADAEKRLSEQKSNELKVQLQAIIQEVQKVAASTGELAQELQVAVIQAPANPGIYHIIFFEKLLGFLQSFRKKINEASTWLQSSNKRAQKKNYWNTYKKKGSSFLLSPDHYLQRSAG
jgi:hypothetical protein